MPESWPLDLIPFEYSFGLEANTFRHESIYTKTIRTVQLQGARYVCNMRVQAKTRLEAQRIVALLERLSGSANTIMLFDPDHIEPLGPNLDRSSLPTTQFIEGDLIELNGRIYGIIEDATANASGRAYLVLNRPLLRAVTNNTAVVRSRPKSPFVLTTDTQAMRQRGRGERTYTFDLSFVESLL
jgi:hypothetical protein